MTSERDKRGKAEHRAKKPMPQSRRAADMESLRQAATKLDEMLAKHNIDEDEIVREFQRLRRSKE